MVHGKIPLVYKLVTTIIFCHLTFIFRYIFLEQYLCVMDKT